MGQQNPGHFMGRPLLAPDSPPHLPDALMILLFIQGTRLALISGSVCVHMATPGWGGGRKLKCSVYEDSSCYDSFGNYLGLTMTIRRSGRTVKLASHDFG